jgi:hypothetical protein
VEKGNGAFFRWRCATTNRPPWQGGHRRKDRSRAQQADTISLGELIHAEVRTTVEHAVREELAAVLGALRYERLEARHGYRNGHKTRTLTGPTGPLALTVPRATLFSPTAPKEWASTVLPRYQRRLREVNTVVAMTYLAGASTRRLKGALQPLLKDRVNHPLGGEPLREDRPMTLDHSVHGLRLHAIQRAQAVGNVQRGVPRTGGSRAPCSTGGATAGSAMGRTACIHAGRAPAPGGRFKWPRKSSAWYRRWRSVRTPAALVWGAVRH